MLALLLTVRDLLLAMALSWIGITFEAPSASPHKQPEPVKTCGAGESVCTSLAAGFDALECAKR